MNHTDTEEKHIGERHKRLSDKGKNLSKAKASKIGTLISNKGYDNGENLKHCLSTTQET